MVQVAPSICSGPLVHLQEKIQNLEAAGADYIHFDIEDGCFVPAMNLGVKVIRELRPLTALPFDVHLMMVNPEWLLPQLAVDGANRVWNSNIAGHSTGVVIAGSPLVSLDYNDYYDNAVNVSPGTSPGTHAVFGAPCF